MKSKNCIGLLLAAAFGAAPAFGGDHAQHADHASHDHAAHTAQVAADSKKQPGKATVTVADIALLDQHGEPRNIKSEVVGDRIVVMDFIYTTCTTVCPVVSATFADLQKRLGDSLGKEVSLVSITIDPARDTPQVLKAYGAKFGARDGWFWLTGQPPVVGDALKGFGGYVGDPAQHPAMVLVGDARTGQWTRFFGFPSASQLMAKVDELRNARSVASNNGKGKNG